MYTIAGIEIRSCLQEMFTASVSESVFLEEGKRAGGENFFCGIFD